MKTKPVIGHLIQSLGVGGCEKSLLLTLPKLSGFSHRIFVLKERGDLACEFEKLGIQVTLLSSPHQLISLIRSNQVRLLITYMFHADICGRFLQFFLPCQVIPYLRTTYNYPRYLPARVFEMLTSGLVGNYLANSPVVKDHYVSRLKVDSEKITVIPNGIEITRPVHIKHTGINILCVANFHPNKGHEYLISAFGKINRSGITLFLVGDGQTLEEMKKMAGNQPNSNNIVFLGKRHDVEEIMKTSDIFVLPTLFEGLSRSLLAAMGAELAVVATDINENRFLVTHNQNGLLVLPRDISALTTALSTLIFSADLRRRLASAAYNKVSREFDQAVTNRRLTAYINSIIKK